MKIIMIIKEKKKRKPLIFLTNPRIPPGGDWCPTARFFVNYFYIARKKRRSCCNCVEGDKEERKERVQRNYLPISTRMCTIGAANWDIRWLQCMRLGNEFIQLRKDLWYNNFPWVLWIKLNKFLKKIYFRKTSEIKATDLYKFVNFCFHAHYY